MLEAVERAAKEEPMSTLDAAKNFMMPESIKQSALERRRSAGRYLIPTPVWRGDSVITIE